jgi:hypothetical protein
MKKEVFVSTLLLTQPTHGPNLITASGPATHLIYQPAQPYPILRYICLFFLLESRHSSISKSTAFVNLCTPDQYRNYLTLLLFSSLHLLASYQIPYLNTSMRPVVYNVYMVAASERQQAP